MVCFQRVQSSFTHRLKYSLKMKKLLTGIGPFDINRHTDYGAVAQLGERLNGIQEVSGSIPLSSTKIKKKKGQASRLALFLLHWTLDSMF